MRHLQAPLLPRDGPQAGRHLSGFPCWEGENGVPPRSPARKRGPRRPAPGASGGSLSLSGQGFLGLLPHRRARLEPDKDTSAPRARAPRRAAPAGRRGGEGPTSLLSGTRCPHVTEVLVPCSLRKSSFTPERRHPERCAHSTLARAPLDHPEALAQPHVTGYEEGPLPREAAAPPGPRGG